MITRGGRPGLPVLLAISAVAFAQTPGEPPTAAEGVAFTDITKETGITFSHVSAPDKKFIVESMSGGVAMFDFDKDGFQDLNFVNAPTVATASEHNDGDLDVVVNNLDGAPTVLRNDGGNDRNFLVVELEGRTANRNAVGAVVTVRAADLVQRAERRSGDSYLSRSDPRLHFGLDNQPRVDSLEVRWPGGAVQVFSGIAANTFIRIVEGASAPATLPVPERVRK